MLCVHSIHVFAYVKQSLYICFFVTVNRHLPIFHHPSSHIKEFTDHMKTQNVISMYEVTIQIDSVHFSWPPLCQMKSSRLRTSTIHTSTLPIPFQLDFSSFICCCCMNFQSFGSKKHSHPDFGHHHDRDNTA